MALALLKVAAALLAYECVGRNLFLRTKRQATSDHHSHNHDAQRNTPVMEQSFPCCKTQKRKDPYDPSPRQGALSWDDYFMSVAFLSAQRSKDPNRQVGACIVARNKVILGIGYNGFPRGCHDTELPWCKLSTKGILHTKHPYVVHAEANALLNKNHSDISGASIYVTLFPCNECAKLLIQAGIEEVVFFEDKLGEVTGHVCQEGGKDSVNDMTADDMYHASKLMLKLAKVKVRQHRPQVRLQLVLENECAK